jgi:hypothetical protein
MPSAPRHESCAALPGVVESPHCSQGCAEAVENIGLKATVTDLVDQGKRLLVVTNGLS